MTETQTMADLDRKYPYIPAQGLYDLLGVEASEEQLARRNDECKIKIDKGLRDHKLMDIPEIIKSSEKRRRLAVAVIGASGSGKSVTGNTLLQDQIFVTSASAVTQTTDFQIERTNIQDDLLYTVTDTLGSWTIPKEKKIDLYILVINLASPRFEKRHLQSIRHLKDYNNIISNKRCIVLLTHATDVLKDKTLTSYLNEIKGDPLYDLIITDMEGWRVLAINNSCDTKYEEDSQWKMIMDILKGADIAASHRTSCLPTCCVDGLALIKEYYPVIIGVGAFCLFVFIVGITLFVVEQMPE